MKKKKIFALLIIVFISSITQVRAQTEKGKFLIGTGSNLEFSSINSKWKNNDNSGEIGKSISLNFNAQIGYFVFKNCAMGFLIPYNYSKEIDADEGHDYTSIFSSISLIPFLAIYIGNSKAKPYLYGGIGPGRGMTKYFNSGGDETKVPSKVLAYEIGVGLGLFINEYISFDLGFDYASISDKWLDESTNLNWKNTSNGFGTTIGITVYL